MSSDRIKKFLESDSSSSSSSSSSSRTVKRERKKSIDYPTIIHVPIEMTFKKAIKFAKRSNGITSMIEIDETSINLGDGIVIDFPIKILGAGTEHTIIIGEITIEGDKKKKKYVSFSNVLIESPNGHGFWNDGGLPLHLDTVEIKNCKFNGVYVAFGAHATLVNCNVHHCQTALVVNGFGTGCRTYDMNCHHNKHSGVWASNGAVVDIYGSEVTAIHHNALLNMSAYGILSQHSGTIIYLHMEVSPSKNNTKKRDQCKRDHGSIIHVEETDDIMEMFDHTNKIVLRIPEDAPTLFDCLMLAKERGADVIYLSEGSFHNDNGGDGSNGKEDDTTTNNSTTATNNNRSQSIEIDFPIKIEGRGKKRTVLNFGIIIKKDSSQDYIDPVSVTLENLSVTNIFGIGVSSNNGMPLVLDTVEIYECENDGVQLINGSSLTCVECYVHNNGGSGVVIGEQLMSKDDVKDDTSENKSNDNSGWGEFTEDLTNVPSGDLTNVQISCNNLSGLLVGDKAFVSFLFTYFYVVIIAALLQSL
jgi:hypothetical protein